jgi:hypothetical protein
MPQSSNKVANMPLSPSVIEARRMVAEMLLDAVHEDLQPKPRPRLSIAALARIRRRMVNDHR